MRVLPRSGLVGAQRGPHPVARKRQGRRADAGGVADRVGQRRRDRVERRLAHRLGAERAERVDVSAKCTSVRGTSAERRAGGTRAGPRGLTCPCASMSTCSNSAAPSACADAALDLAAALRGLMHRAGVGGLHAVQDRDLAGGRADRDPEALHVERHRARRARRTSPCGASSSRPSPASGVDQRRASARRRAQRGQAGDHRAGRAVRAGVVARPGRCRTGAARCRRARHPSARGGELAVHGGGAVAELGRARPRSS